MNFVFHQLFLFSFADLEFDGFYKFMKNLQTEVLELEFHEFSKGHEKVNLKIVHKNTNLTNFLD
jgi:hypothetical protein